MFKKFSKITSKENVTDFKMQKVQHAIAEIRLDSLVSDYKFRLSKSSLDGAYILVKESSAILGFLKSSKNLEIHYYPSSSTESVQTLKTKTSYIIDALKGSTNSSRIVGLSTI